MLSNLAERLASLRKEGESVHAFAKRLGVPDSTMRQYLKDTIPSADVALRISDATNVDYRWLVAGDGVKERVSSRPMDKPSSEYADEMASSGMIMVPRFDVQASAGHGAVPQSENIIDSVAFNATWLRERGINPGFASILEARGDSMEPSIRDGDLLVVDRSITTAVGNGIYIVIFGGNVLVKRINMRRDGTLVLISDNERYGQETVPADEVPDIHIAARVMWYGRSI